MKDEYRKAYKEVYEILKFYPKELISMLPKDIIDFFYENKDNNYYYIVNPLIPLENQKMSEITKAILLDLYNKYFINDRT